MSSPSATNSVLTSEQKPGRHNKYHFKNTCNCRARILHGRTCSLQRVDHAAAAFASPTVQIYSDWYGCAGERAGYARQLSALVLEYLMGEARCEERKTKEF